MIKKTGRSAPKLTREKHEHLLGLIAEREKRRSQKPSGPTLRSAAYPNYAVMLIREKNLEVGDTARITSMGNIERVISEVTQHGQILFEKIGSVHPKNVELVRKAPKQKTP